MPATSPDRTYDLVLFGATGFVGGLTADYLAAHAPTGLRWALAGRNRGKLEAVRARLAKVDARCAELALLKVDATDAEAVRGIARAARVVITTVGPYLQYGEGLVAACAAAGTDYVDLTGEPGFVDAMWLKYHATAVGSGARIVHCCGFDSIPHDLGAWFTVQQLPHEGPLRVEGFVRTNGHFSAGTYHSAINQFSQLGSAARVARERRQREARPDGRRVGKLAARIHHDVRLRAWLVPMPTIDPQIVRRSARALECYGPNFSYAHYVQVKKLTSVAALVGGAAGLVALAQIGPTRRWLMARQSSGEGPSAEQRARSRFSVRFRGRSLAPQPREVWCQVSGGDPGYGETSKMLAESALCLAFDELAPCAGQVTPAQAMGGKLVERLQRAGIAFEVLEGV
ncbi:MAG TPA: saccharopine dehydrogenase NADP-binding domain-containing protein [Nevskiaceae bacterium]|nr:saccharopine dehydrogenase NADP-binding domain-containing protein [Nevskiaceae bacterium]